MLTLAEADAELQRVTLLKKNHLDEQYVARRSVRDLPGTIAGMSDRLSKLTIDQQTATDHACDPIIIGGRAPAREDISDILGGKLDALPRDVRDTRRIPLGIYRGLGFGLVLHPQFPASVFLEGAIARQSALSREHQGPRAVLNALERLAGGYDAECTRAHQDLAVAESQLRDYHVRLGKPFVHERYLAELTGFRDQLKAGLSATGKVEGDDDGKPTVTELAEKIKVLKAAHSIETAPQRIRQKRAAAEEPVTARIRRHWSANHPVSNPVNISNDIPKVTAASDHCPSPDSPLTFRDRIVMERLDDSPKHSF